MKKIKKFLCTTCGAEYKSSALSIPYLVAWDDGHVCDPILVAEQEEQKKFKIVDLTEYEELGTTWYN